MQFIMIMLAVSGLFYVLSGILFWASDYFRKVLKVKQKTVIIYFAIASITGPIFSALASIYLVRKLGGFNSKLLLPLCFFISTCCVFVGVFVPVFDSFKYALACIWGVMFLGGTLLPLLTGKMLKIVDERLLGKSNALSNICYNLFGWLPAPYVYGLICYYTEGETSRWGMKCLMFSMVIPSLFVFLAIFAKTNNNKNIEVIQNDSESNAVSTELKVEEEKKI